MNAHEVLRPSGRFFIVDWSDFPLQSVAPAVKLFFQTMECELAWEFIQSDLGGTLHAAGFAKRDECPLGGRYLRRLAAGKSSI